MHLRERHQMYKDSWTYFKEYVKDGLTELGQEDQQPLVSSTQPVAVAAPGGAAPVATVAARGGTVSVAAAAAPGGAVSVHSSSRRSRSDSSSSLSSLEWVIGGVDGSDDDETEDEDR